MLHEEISGDPSKISLRTRIGQEICGYISETDPPPTDTWKRISSFSPHFVPQLRLSCEKGWHINSIGFSSFGTPQGSCGHFTTGSCHADMLQMVKQVRCVFFFGLCFHIYAESNVLVVLLLLGVHWP